MRVHTTHYDDPSTRRPPLVAQVQASISLALTLNPRLLMYTEPDKESFFTSKLCGFVPRALTLNPELSQNLRGLVDGIDDSAGS